MNKITLNEDFLRQLTTDDFNLRKQMRKILLYLNLNGIENAEIPPILH